MGGINHQYVYIYCIYPHDYPIVKSWIGGICINHSQSWLVYDIVLYTLASGKWTGRPEQNGPIFEWWKRVSSNPECQGRHVNLLESAGDGMWMWYNLHYPAVIKHGNGKFLINGILNDGKIIYKWGIVHWRVWSLEGKSSFQLWSLKKCDHPVISIAHLRIKLA